MKCRTRAFLHMNLGWNGEHPYEAEWIVADYADYVRYYELRASADEKA